MIGIVPTVSVVVIFLDAERFLRDALESITRQTFNDWELILVDDGSTDGGPAIARQFADSLPGRASLLEHAEHSRRGMSASRNLGVRHARGEYIAFLDADDVWQPEKLEQQVAILVEQRRADAVFGRTRYWESWPGSGKGPDDDVIPELGVPPGSLIAPPCLLRLLYPLGRHGSAPSLSNLMVRRQSYEFVGGFEERFAGLYEDQAFLAKLYLHCWIFVADACWDLYRRHPDSCCAVVERQGRYHDLRRVYLEWLEEYLDAQRVEDKVIRRLLASALRRYRVPLAHGALRMKEWAFEQARRIARSFVPTRLRRAAWLRIQGVSCWPPAGFVRFGSLRRVTPISAEWGENRGIAIDRFYIERFLARCATDVRGAVLEVQEDQYTRHFGGDRVTNVDVLSVAPGNPRATIVADLSTAPQIADDSYDCLIVTQTLQLIYDAKAAIRTMHRILRPGGVALVTVPGISKIARDEVDGWSTCWHFTELSAARAFADVFGAGHVTTTAHGNVLAVVAFLHGLAVGELRQSELEYDDRDFPLVIEVRARKSASPE